MKNINSLLARLGSLSLAATLVFSVANAASARKDSKVAAAVIEALVQQAVGQENQADRVVKAQSFSDDVTIGSATRDSNLTVYGAARINGDITAGKIGNPGQKYIIGQQTLNPVTQQLELRFKDKKAGALGAWVDLDFVTTATSYRLGVSDIGHANVAVRSHGIYCHPQMTPGQIMGITGGSKMNFKGTTTSRVFNGPARTSFNDFNLTLTVRHEAITNNILFGFVPYSAEYPVTGGNNGKGFYEANWNSPVYNTTHPIWNPGLVSYKVVSGNLAGLSVTTSVADTLQTLDVFDLFSDADLEMLLESLNAYFGNDSTKVKAYLAENRHRLARAFKALNS
jgi:hypothetical protein